MKKLTYLFVITCVVAVVLSGCVSNEITEPYELESALSGELSPMDEPFEMIYMNDVIYNMYYTITHGTMWSQIFYTHPLVFVSLQIALDSLFGGLFACLSITAGMFTKNKIAVVAVPYLYCCVI